MHTEHQPNGERENNPGLESTASQPAAPTDPLPSTDPPIHQSINPTPSAPAQRGAGRRRRGKVARLPQEIRLRVNELLDDGFPYAAIIKRLGRHGKGLTEDCIRSWKRGGYQDYLRQQRLAEQCRQSQERAFDLIRQTNPINAFQAAQQLASAQICEVAAESGADILREALKANPLNYFRMLNSFSRLATGGLKCEKHLADHAERNAQLLEEDDRRPGGISREVLEQIERETNLM